MKCRAGNRARSNGRTHAGIGRPCYLHRLFVSLSPNREERVALTRSEPVRPFALCGILPLPALRGEGWGQGRRKPARPSALRAILPLAASWGESCGEWRRKPAQPSALRAILPLPVSRGEGWGEGRRKPARPSALRAILPLPASRGEGWGQGRRKPAQPFACIRSSYERRRAAGSNVQVLTTISPSSSRCASERSIAITCAPVPTNALRRSSPMRACSAAV